LRHRYRDSNPVLARRRARVVGGGPEPATLPCIGNGDS
jgi:hypothetical protein